MFFKKNALKFWTTFCERFASPTLVGKYPSGTTEDQKAALLDVLESVQQEASMIMPEGITIEVLNAMSGGTFSHFQDFIGHMDTYIARIILGQTLTTEMPTSGVGSYAAAKTHDIVRQDIMDIINMDAYLLSQCLNNTVVKWLTEFNFPLASPPVFCTETLIAGRPEYTGNAVQDAHRRHGPVSCETISV
ncbi:protein containing DUF935 [Candidatus Magnetobacterium bavaricum]|uniref:Protein containing DUF935 n=1 Tax=Candidatus Magnetobacterium bavaricum TaxID=29290 RepID=A0A0F3GU63_9BACT|nr:protein containing DUF935 [Candidatus Magnetobacterium bavaricum]